MKKTSKQILDIGIRYLLLVAVAIPNLWFFYFIFTSLTIYPANFILGLIFDSSLSGNVITISNCFPIELIGACIGASAYYLLFILNFATPGIDTKKRIRILAFAFLAFLVLNLLRIILLSIMFVSGSSLLDVTHKVFWYLLSTLFVVGIWFAEVKLFKIKAIPFYSDLNWLYKKIK